MAIQLYSMKIRRKKIVLTLIIQLFCLFHGLDAKPRDKIEYNNTVSNIHKTVFQINISKDNLKNAVNQCKSAIKNYPNSAEIYLYLAIAHYRLGEFTNSFSIIKKGKRILTTQISKKYPIKTNIKTQLLLEIKEFEKLILGRLKQEKYRLNLKKEYLLKGQGPSSE